MQPARFDLLGIGNAIVDVIAAVPHDFLQRHDMRPGAMALIDAATATRLTEALPDARQSGGGSAANTCATAAALGARVAYAGKVADDALGQAFGRDIAASGVHFATPPLHGGAPTARCVVLVTPDAQRTMNTFLGASVALGEPDIDEALVADSAVTYLEGYLFDPPAAQAAFRRAAAAAHRAGRQVALSLSDAFCVGRHRDAFRDLVRNEVDILFANEAEICSLYRCDRFEDAAAQARAEVALAALTRGEQGSMLYRGAESVTVAAAPAAVLDTTGAGDAYAAGVLAALAAGRDLAQAGRVGSLAAAAVIAQYGARPPEGLRARAGL